MRTTCAGVIFSFYFSHLIFFFWTFFFVFLFGLKIKYVISSSYFFVNPAAIFFFRWRRFSFIVNPAAIFQSSSACLCGAVALGHLIK